MPPIKVLEYLMADLYWTPESGIFEEIFKQTSADSSDEQLKEYSIEKMKVMGLIGSNDNVIGLMVDTSLFFREISPELQKWTDENFIPFLNDIGLKRCGMVFSQGLFEQLSIEDSVDVWESKYEVRFFPSVLLAKQWLLELSAKRVNSMSTSEYCRQSEF